MLLFFISLSNVIVLLTITIAIVVTFFPLEKVISFSIIFAFALYIERYIVIVRRAISIMGAMQKRKHMPIPKMKQRG